MTTLLFGCVTLVTVVDLRWLRRLLFTLRSSPDHIYVGLLRCYHCYIVGLPFTHSNTLCDSTHGYGCIAVIYRLLLRYTLHGLPHTLCHTTLFTPFP